jgi:hypothetical protein
MCGLKNARAVNLFKRAYRAHIGWNWWDSPKRNLIPDLARGDYHNWSLFRDPTWVTGGKLTSIPK